MSLSVVITEDGSPTLFAPNFEEHYHSIHGAVQESMHVFIQAGLCYFSEKKELSIFEMGFGTGLNAYLTAKNKTSQSAIYYESVELFPVATEMLENAFDKSTTPDFDADLYQNIITSPWENRIEIAPNFSLNKQTVAIQDYIPSQVFDIIYYDAFAPAAQPELWEKSIFEKMYTMLKPTGVLVTYCAKGAVKRTLKEVGFKIEELPGPPGKREMTRAIKMN